MRNVTFFFQDIVTSMGAQLSVPAWELKDPLACGDRPTEARRVDGGWLKFAALGEDASKNIEKQCTVPQDHILRSFHKRKSNRAQIRPILLPHFLSHVNRRARICQKGIIRFSIFIIIEPFYLQNFATSNKQQCTRAPRSTLPCHHHQHHH